MSRFMFNNPENRQACLYEFLQNLFGKPIEDITRDELLSLTSRDFQNPKINKTSVGRASSLYVWATNSKDRNGQNVIFFIFKDAGLAGKHNITNSDFKGFDSQAVRKVCLYEFLKNKFNKEVKNLSTEELLSLTTRDFQNPEINRTSVGSAGTLCMWAIKSKDRNGQNLIFYIVKDAGLHDKHQLTNSDFKTSANQYHHGVHSIFSSPSNRKACLYEFLKNKFNKEVKNLSTEELLSLTTRDFQNPKINKTSVGSARALFKWASKSKGRNGQNVIFYLLKDAGLSDSHSIMEKDITDKFLSIRAQNFGRNRQIVFIENKLIPNTETISQIDTAAGLVSRGETTQIQAIFSTTKLGENCQKENVLSSKVQQVLDHYFAGNPSITSANSYQKLHDAIVGEALVICSTYPLDEIYKSGLEKLGFQITNENLAHPQVQGQYFTQIIRTEQKSDAVPIMFENDLNPVKTTLHVLGQYGRMAYKAESEVELYHATGLGLEWLITATNSGIIPESQIAYVKSQGLDKLAKMESRGMARLGVKLFASDIKDRYNEVALKLAPAKIRAEQTVERAIRREKFARTA